VRAVYALDGILSRSLLWWRFEMKIVGVANARAGFPALLARAAREPAIVARYGRPVGVVLGVRRGAGVEQVERAIRAFLAEMEPFTSPAKRERSAP
jgi:hypothetical protein